MEAFKCKIHIYLVERQVLCTHIYILMLCLMFFSFHYKRNFHFIFFPHIFLSLMFYDCSLTLLFHIVMGFYFLLSSNNFSSKLFNCFPPFPNHHYFMEAGYQCVSFKFNVHSYDMLVRFISKTNITIFNPYIACCLLRHVFKMMIRTNYNKSQQGGSCSIK